MSIDLPAIKYRVNCAYLPERDDRHALGAALGDLKMLVAEVERLQEEGEGLRAKLTRDHATHMSREDWFASIIDNVEKGRIDDRHAVIDFLRALGHTAAADAIADAGFPLFACLPPVTEATMKKVGGNTDD